MTLNNFIPISQWEYGDSSLLTQKYGGVIVSQGYVTSFEAFDISNRNHQTRQKGEDRGHIDDLIGSIEAVGLRRAPTVKYDPISGKFQPLGGHHRLISINKMRSSPSPKRCHEFKDGFPVLVVEFSDKMQEEFFCVEDNNHEPAKTHSTNDVVDFLLRIDDKGHFNNKNKEDAKSEIYNIINNTFNHFGAPRTKNSIFNKWVTKRGKASARSVYPSSEELYEEARVHWHLPSDSAKWKLKVNGSAIHPSNKKVRLIIGPESATRKTFYNAFTDGLLKAEYYTYRIFTSLGCKASSMTDARDSVLKRHTAWNINMNDKHQITEIVFRGQINGETHQRYIWNKHQKSFAKK
jgi:hypothetical protein